jgi:hypothetical protein
VHGLAVGSSLGTNDGVGAWVRRVVTPVQAGRDHEDTLVELNFELGEEIRHRDDPEGFARQAYRQHQKRRLRLFAFHA